VIEARFLDRLVKAVDIVTQRKIGVEDALEPLRHLRQKRRLVLQLQMVAYETRRRSERIWARRANDSANFDRLDSSYCAHTSPVLTVSPPNSNPFSRSMTQMSRGMVQEF
jgi:hypothetical protein